MPLPRIVSWIEQQTGMTPASLGKNTLTDVVDTRMRELGLKSQEAYADRLTLSPTEGQILIERLVIPETWFFRSPPLFLAVIRNIQQQIVSGRVKPFRILSLPCSTGEEPYTLAIALTEANVPQNLWSIDGIDISQNAVFAAIRGVYRDFSFRETTLALRERFFKLVGDAWELDESIRKTVRFRVANALDPNALRFEANRYDFVFCRNLMIYLTPLARQQLLEILRGLLAPGGWLAVGHAEAFQVASAGFIPTGPENAFLFTTPVAPAVSPHAPTNNWVNPAAASGSSARLPGLTPPVPAPPPLAVPPTLPLATNPSELLVEARRCANLGKVDDALRACQAALVAQPSAEGYCLLGVISQVKGDAGAAAEAYRKALYLNPKHRESLTHAMLFHRGRGDVAQADGLRRRLDELGSENGGAP
jgi:chemotaxis protein methyltransferase WspC